MEKIPEKNRSEGLFDTLGPTFLIKITVITCLLFIGGKVVVIDYGGGAVGTTKWENHGPESFGAPPSKQSFAPPSFKG